jgi:transcriptional regulator with XRE-family HTH domain
LAYKHNILFIFHKKQNVNREIGFLAYSVKYMGFRENLKTELSYSGILVKELAVQSGLKKHTIDNYLSVRGRMPAADVAVSIAHVLGVSVEYLITGNETPNNNSTVHFSPEIRQMACIVEKLNPDYRKIALSFIETLKKHEDSQNNTTS